MKAVLIQEVGCNMAELLAANQITIAKVLDGEKGEKGDKGEMSAEQLAQLNQASEDASQAKSDVANLEIGGRNLAKRENIIAFDTSFSKIDGYEYTQLVGNGAGIKFPAGMFTEDTEYVLSFKFQKVSGTLTSIAGHSTAFETRDVIINSESFSQGWMTTHEIEDSEAIQTCVVYLRRKTASENSGLDNNLYIQPERSRYHTSNDITIKYWDIKIEKGNKTTDWTPAPEDVDAGIDNAAKVATNYLHYDSTDGLVLGNKESGSWVGYRTQIDNDSFNVLDENGNIIASYGSNEVELGKGNPSAIIKMCDGKAYVKNYIVGSQNTSVFCGQDVTVVGEWEGASESYALFKQGFVNIGQSGSHIIFTNETDNENHIEIQGQNITMRRVTNVGDFNCYMDANFKGSVTIATPLPISSGGTGATNAAEARSNLGLSGAQIKTLLWTNASPSSQFANQTLSLSLSEYDAVEIECCYGSSYTNVVETGIYKKSYTQQYMTCHGDIKTNNTGFYISQRLVTATASGITFGKGTYKNISAAAKGAEGNNYCIPLKIYGIKGV